MGSVSLEIKARLLVREAGDHGEWGGYRELIDDVGSRKLCIRRRRYSEGKSHIVGAMGT